MNACETSEEILFETTFQVAIFSMLIFCLFVGFLMNLQAHND